MSMDDTTSASRYWYACAEPLRATDPWVLWHYEDCPGCGARIDALIQQFPTDADVRALAKKMAGDTSPVELKWIDGVGLCESLNLIDWFKKRGDK